MSDPAPVVASLAGASQSLRDTAKWLVGGVTATSVGIFAGSSLTAFGSLTPAVDTLRFSEAVVGLSLGFVGLGFIINKALRVLTRDSTTFREFATSTCCEITRARTPLLRRYRERLPPGATTFEDYVNRVQAAVYAVPRTPGDQALIERARVDNDIISADASLFLVRARFDELISTLRWATFLALVGFGLFAWAANPPKGKSEPAAFSLTIK